MKSLYRFFLMAVLVLALISTPLTDLVRPVSAASSPCVDTLAASGLYTATICISTPTDGATFTGNGTISANVSFSGTGPYPGAQSITFFLNGAYVLTGFTNPTTFTLPTNMWVDGTYTLSADAVLRDATTTNQANISVTFTTGTTVPPVNTNTFTPTSGRPASPGQPFTVMATGDGAGGEPIETTVTNRIATLNPNLFLYLGDVYQQGSTAEFFNWYGVSTLYGQFKSITDPTVGHHEYLTANAAPYFFYWDNVPSYYSFNAHGWHFISLSSNGIDIGGVGPSSPEYKWLQGDLAANTATCTLAYYHHPLYSIGPEGTEAAMVDIWKLLQQNHVSIVLNGNDHDYERWAPLDGNGVPAANGITEFVLGTGGHSMQTVVNSDPRVANWTDANPAAFGALQLTLNSTNAQFQYISAGDGSVLDSGTIGCVTASTPSIYNLYLPLILK